MKKPVLPQLGSLLSAVLASACCLLPLVLASLGLGALGIASVLAPYRSVFVAITLAFLGTSFYLVYRRPKGEDCASGAACPPAGGASRANKITLWILTALVLGILGFPSLLALTS
jgi:mercuric ion transport protein